MSDQTVINFEVTDIRSESRNGGSWGNESADVRTPRMAAYFADPTNSKLVKLGKLFVKHGETLATKKTIAMPAFLSVDGVKLELAPDQKISLDTIKFWGCLACGSAHGSGVYPSREVSAKNLAKNQWFYHPITKRIFTISNECLETYVPGGSKSKHLIKATDLKPVAPTTPAQPESKQVASPKK